MGKGEHPTAHTARGTGGLPGHRRLGDWEGLGVEEEWQGQQDWVICVTFQMSWHLLCHLLESLGHTQT